MDALAYTKATKCGKNQLLLIEILQSYRRRGNIDSILLNHIN